MGQLYVSPPWTRDGSSAVGGWSQLLRTKHYVERAHPPPLASKPFFFSPFLTGLVIIATRDGSRPNCEGLEGYLRKQCTVARVGESHG